jgi:hypothetical protein
VTGVEAASGKAKLPGKSSNVCGHKGLG